MADEKISEKVELTEPASNDVLAAVDVSMMVTRKITLATLFGSVVASIVGAAASTYSLGSTSFRWLKGWFDSIAVTNIDGDVNTENVYPKADNTYTLGSAIKRWIDGHFGQITLGGVTRSTWPAAGSATVGMDDTYNNGSVVNVDDTDEVHKLTTAKHFKLTDAAGTTIYLDVDGEGNVIFPFANKQDAMLANPRAFAQAIHMTGAASGSNGITVADDANFHFGTGNFTLRWKGRLPDWTPAVGADLLFNNNSTWILAINPAGHPYLYLNGHANTASESISAVDNSEHEIVAVITTGATRTYDFYVDGYPLGVQQTHSYIATITIISSLQVLGEPGYRSGGDVSFATLYNRALTAAEVLDLYRNGINSADKWGSQTSLITGDNSTFASNTGWWSASGGASIGSGSATIPQGEYIYNISNIPRIKGKMIRFNAVFTGNLQVADGVNTVIVPVSGVDSEILLEDIATNFVLVGGAGGTVVDTVTLYEIGATLALEPEGIQPNPGQWLDSSTNKLHAMQPAAGSEPTRRLKTFEIRWTNTWAGTHEAQYICGINQAVLPVNGYIDEIIGVIAGTTIEDIIIGDGSDTDRWVEITTGLAPGTRSFTLANRINDGTNYKLVVDPDANFTGSIAFTIRGHILQ